MDARIKALWLAALRSGEYKQTEGRLNGEIVTGWDEKGEPTKTERGFCCLGVLCDLHRKEVGEAEGHTWVRATVAASCTDSEYMDEGSTLPPAVALWAGFRDSGGHPISNPSASWTTPNEDYDPEDLVNADDGPEIEHIDSLAEANDSGLGFDEIAGIIERQH